MEWVQVGGHGWGLVVEGTVLQGTKTLIESRVAMETRIDGGALTGEDMSSFGVGMTTDIERENTSI